MRHCARFVSSYFVIRLQCMLFEMYKTRVAVNCTCHTHVTPGGIAGRQGGHNVSDAKSLGGAEKSHQ